MKTFKAALIQQKSVLGNKEWNFQQIKRLLKEIDISDIELVLLPELNLTGHGGHKDIVSQAETIPNGPYVQKMISLAKTYNCVIGFGMAEEDRGIFYNTYVLVGENGYIGKQRKTHLSGDEYFYFKGGMEVPVFDLEFARVGIVICYDNSLPEISRIAAIKGAEVLLCPHASRVVGKVSGPQIAEYILTYKKGWEMIHAVRAGDNNAYILLVDAVGDSAENYRDVNAVHVGGCMAIDPYGRVIAQSEDTSLQEEIVIVEIDAQVVEQRRQEVCNPMRTRRPEVFAPLSEFIC